MEVIDNRGAPPELVLEIFTECMRLPVKYIVFDAFIEDLNGALGAFNPDTGTIYIDMGACITDKNWMKKGILFIPNVWLNLLMVGFHEAAHAFQLNEEPELACLDELPQDYEDEAAAIAEKRLLQWAKKPTVKVPTLNELGWVGDQIKFLFNKLYAQMPEYVNEELDLQGTDLIANAEIAAAASKEYCAPEEIALLLKQIDEGSIGGKYKQKKYLTAYEAIDLDHVEHVNPNPKYMEAT